MPAPGRKNNNDADPPSESEPGFVCSSSGSGWIIPSGWQDDDWCDCPDCQDEPRYTCETCGACPLTCGASAVCFEPQPSCGIEGDIPYFCTSTPGFFIDSVWVNDFMCDCPLCEDEFNITCEQCGGCPVFCNDYVPCDLGYSPDLVTTSTRDLILGLGALCVCFQWSVLRS